MIRGFSARVRRIVAIFLLVLPAVVAAGPGLSPDPTGLWFSPDEPGWGMSIAQQGGTLFVVLFVYDDAKRPAWYVASDVTATGTTVALSNEALFSGPLYRTSGPWFGTTFDRNAVSVAPVGDIQLSYVPTDAGKSLIVIYRIDSVSVTKTVQPQTWGDNRALLVGHFSGGVKLDPVSPSTCPALSNFVNATLVTITGSLNAGSGKLDILWGTGSDTFCVLSAPYQQRGQLGSLAGTLQCGPVPAPSDFGAMQAAGIAASDTGFSANASLQRNGCSYTGTIGGVRQP